MIVATTKISQKFLRERAFYLSHDDSLRELVFVGGIIAWKKGDVNRGGESLRRSCHWFKPLVGDEI